MTDQTTVERRVADWFLECLHLDIPSPTTDLLETGVLDSLGFVELLLFLEQEFGVEVTLEEVEIDTFRSIERIVAFLHGHGAGAASSVERAGHGVTG